TTRGGSVHFAPFGSGGMLIVHLSDSRTNIENAIDFPSGDQRALRGDSVTRVTWVAGPSTSTQRTKSCAPFGSPSARYARRLPSGDHRGADPLTKNRFWLPPALIIQISDSHLSAIWSTCSRVYRTREPSGEICASLTRSQSR